MKKVIFGALVAMAAVAVHAEAMYWQVSSMTDKTGFTDSDWAYAQIEVVNSDGSSLSPGPVYLKINGTDSDLLAKDAGGAWFDLGTYGSAEYSFLLELVNDSFDVAAAAKTPTSYADLGSSGQNVLVSNFDTISPLSYTSWNAGAVDLPEPTSGLLMLLGASLLALRRRQA